MDDRNAPATKGDVADLRAEIKGDLADLRAEINQKLDQMNAEANHRYDDLVERIADSQTEVLKAFYNFAQTNQKRMVELEGNEAAIRSRIGTLEGRVLEIEKRLNIPPAA